MEKHQAIWYAFTKLKSTSRANLLRHIARWIRNQPGDPLWADSKKEANPNHENAVLHYRSLNCRAAISHNHGPIGCHKLFRWKKMSFAFSRGLLVCVESTLDSFKVHLKHLDTSHSNPCSLAKEKEGHKNDPKWSSMDAEGEGYIEWSRYKHWWLK